MLCGDVSSCVSLIPLWRERHANLYQCFNGLLNFMIYLRSSIYAHIFTFNGNVNVLEYMFFCTLMSLVVSTTASVSFLLTLGFLCQPGTGVPVEARIQYLRGGYPVVGVDDGGRHIYDLAVRKTTLSLPCASPLQYERMFYAQLSVYARQSLQPSQAAPHSLRAEITTSY